VWIAFNNGEYTLLDGAHRIVASHLENKQTVPSYVINNDNNNDNNDNNLIAGLPKIII